MRAFPWLGRALMIAMLLMASSPVSPARAAPGDSCGVGDITDYGATGDDTSDDTAAIQAAQAAAGNNGICVPAGRFRFASTITAMQIRGESRQHSVLHYTGTGTAVQPGGTPGVRTHHARISAVAIVSDSAGADLGLDGVVPAPGAPAALIGLDLACHSRGYFEDILITGFGEGIRIRCPTIDGGSLYNTFTDWRVGGATNCVRITGLSSNENKFFGGHCNVSGGGVRIEGGNRNSFIGNAFESGGTGIDILNVDSDRTHISDNRFENLTGFSVRVASGVKGTVLAWNDRVSTAGAYQTNGTDTAIIGNDPGNGTISMERTGVGTGPLLNLRDTSATGDPLTALLQVSRWSGTALQVTRTSDDVDLLSLNGDGALRLRVVTALPSASRAGAGGLLVYDGPSAAAKLVMSTGSNWVYVDGGGSAP